MRPYVRTHYMTRACTCSKSHVPTKDQTTDNVKKKMVKTDHPFLKILLVCTGCTTTLTYITQTNTTGPCDLHKVRTFAPIAVIFSSAWNWHRAKKRLQESSLLAKKVKAAQSICQLIKMCPLGLPQKQAEGSGGGVFPSCSQQPCASVPSTVPPLLLFSKALIASQ